MMSQSDRCCVNTSITWGLIWWKVLTTFNNCYSYFFAHVSIISKFGGGVKSSVNGIIYSASKGKDISKDTTLIPG